MKKHFTTGTNIHYEKKFGFALKRPVKLNYKGMIKFFHNLALIDNWFDFLFSN